MLLGVFWTNYKRIFCEQQLPMCKIASTGVIRNFVVLWKMGRNKKDKILFHNWIKWGYTTVEEDYSREFTTEALKKLWVCTNIQLNEFGMASLGLISASHMHQFLHHNVMSNSKKDTQE